VCLLRGMSCIFKYNLVNITLRGRSMAQTIRRRLSHSEGPGLVPGRTR
jgi:hypothetical protein